jgi:hypothetical protein
MCMYDALVRVCPVLLSGTAPLPRRSAAEVLDDTASTPRTERSVFSQQHVRAAEARARRDGGAN